MADNKITVLITGNSSQLQSELSKTTSMIDKSFSSIGSIITGALSVGAIVSMGKAALQMGDDFSKASEKLGIGVDKLSALAYAANLSDVSFEALQKGMKFLSKAITEADAAGSDAATAFSVMGIKTKDAEGKAVSLNSVFSQVANKFSMMEDGAGKVSLAVALFGRAGMDMIPVLNKGAAGIAELEGEARRFGATMSGDTAKKLEAANDNLKSFWMAVKGTTASITGGLIGALKGMGDAFGESLGGAEGGFSFGPDAKTFKAPAAPGKTAAPNIGAINKAAEEKKKLLDEYAKLHSANLAKEGAEVHATLAAEMGMNQEYFDTVSKMGMDEFAEWKKGQEEELALLAKFDEEKIAMLKDLQDAQRAEFEYTENPMAAYGSEDAYKAAEAYGNVALAIDQINAGFGEQNLLLEAGKAKIANYLESWGRMSKFAATQFGSMSDSMLKFYNASGQKHREFFRLYQALAIGEALISTYAGIARAFKDYMWPYSMIVAAVVGAAGFAQVANIASQSPAAHGGLDYVPAETTYLLDRGERVISPRQNKDLTDFLGGNGGGGGQQQTIVLQLDGETLARWFNKANRTGTIQLVPA